MTTIFYGAAVVVCNNNSMIRNDRIFITELDNILDICILMVYMQYQYLTNPETLIACPELFLIPSL